MLAKKHRMNTKTFQAVFKEGTTIHGAFIYVTYTKMAGEEKESKAAVVVPGSVSKKAVGRNEMKRRAYSILEKLIPSLISPVYMIVFFKKQARGASFSDLEDDLVKTLQKTNLLPARLAA